jgi:putative membrane protein
MDLWEENNMNFEALARGVVSSLVFSLIGMVVFVAGFFIIKKILPFDVNKEIEVDQNTSLGLVIASFILGLAFIIGMAIHG